MGTATLDKPTQAPAKSTKTSSRPIGGSRFNYVFEAEPGTVLGQGIYIDVPPETFLDPNDDPKDRREAKVWLQRYNQRNDEEKRAVLEQAVLDNGGPKISFRSVVVNKRRKVYYETNSAAIAQVIEWEMESGKLPHFKKIDNSMVWKVGDKVFANNSTGEAAAKAYREEIDGTMSLEKRGT